MWKNKTIVWLDTDHQWNEFGTEISDTKISADTFDAKGIYIWKSKELDEFIEDGISLFESLNDTITDPNMTSGFFLVVSVLCLLPLDRQIIESDEDAKQFLSLVYKEKGEHYLLESELDKFPQLDCLIEHFIDLKLLARENDKLVVQGKILNRVHIK